ncbi:MAG: choice-of-anchor B family protein, partial [Saprospiraceae bacterium]|nr:choice-of-anchor B family protein [Saprospiraceae bacterium]
MKKMLFPVLALALLAFAHPVIAQNFNMVSRATMDFPGQTLANICGYAQNGREYALLGGSLGMIVVDITDPDNPVNLVQIPGPNNLWKEIKVYQHYAYVTSEGGQGLQIIDLSPLPNTTLPYHFYTGDGEIAGQLNTIHALHIDVEKGFVYLYGSNLFSGGPVVLDINADPYNPIYAGNFDQLGYVHDGYAENDILYG